MAYFRPVSEHRIFPVARKGDTLIVTPMGDSCGFMTSEIQAELNQVIKLFDDPRLKNIIIDFSGTNYVGSEMIGVLNYLASCVRERGGRFGVCEASRDMREGLHIMKLDTVWPLYNRRKDAERAIVTQGILEKIQTDPLWMSVVAALVVAAALATWWALSR